MFSSRTFWHRQPNLLAQRLEEIRRSGRRVFDLTVSNPTQAGLQYPSREIREALIPESILKYAPDPLGHHDARAAVAEYYKKKQVSVDPAHIVLTSGSSEAYSFALRLLCEPGESVLAPSPSYPLFDYLADMNDVRCVSYPLYHDGSWNYDPEQIFRDVTPSSRAIVLVHPNNPTGTYLNTQDLAHIADGARRHDMALIVDEVFIDYPIIADLLRAPSTASFDGALTFTINGLSKTAALPQMKLGWVAVSGPPAAVQESMERLAIISDTFLSVNTPVQDALPHLLRLGEDLRAQISRRTEQNLDILRRALERNPRCSLLPVEGGWYATVRVPATRTDEELGLYLLEEAGVYVHPGFLFDFPVSGCLVVSLLTPAAEFVAGVDAMLGVLQGESI